MDTWRVSERAGGTQRDRERDGQRERDGHTEGDRQTCTQRGGGRQMGIDKLAHGGGGKRQIRADRLWGERQMGEGQMEGMGDRQMGGERSERVRDKDI